MNENIDVNEQLTKHVDEYSDAKFLKKAQKTGKGIGFKALSAATTLFAALKSDQMTKSNKLIILGALGYFIFPLDIVADLLPFVGLSDDLFIMAAALTKVFNAITPEMKEEGNRLAAKILKKEIAE